MDETVCRVRPFLLALLWRCVLPACLLLFPACERREDKNREEKIPKTAADYYRKASEEYREGAYRRAVIHYQKSLLLQPDLSRAHLDLGIIYEDHLKDVEKSKEHYEKFLALEGESQLATMVRTWLAGEPPPEEPPPSGEKEAEGWPWVEEGKPEERIKKLEEDLAAAHEEAQTLKKERAALEEKLAVLAATPPKLEPEAASAVTPEDSQATVASLGKALEKAEEERDRAFEEKEKLDGRVKRLQDDLSRTREEVKTLKKGRRKPQGEGAASARKIAELGSSLSEAREERDRAFKEKGELDGRVKSLQDDLSRAREEIKSLKEGRLKPEGEGPPSAASARKIAELESSLSKAKEEKEGALGEKKRLAEENRKLRESQKKAETQKDFSKEKARLARSFEKEKKSLQEKLGSAQGKLKNREADVKRLKDEASARERTRRELNASVKRLTAKVSNLENKLKEASRLARDRESGIRDKTLQDVARQREMEKRELDAKFNQERASFQKMYEQKIRSVEIKLTQANTVIENLREESRNHFLQAQKAQAEVKRLQTEYARIQAQLKNLSTGR